MIPAPEWNPHPFRPAPSGARLAEMAAAIDALGAPAPEPLVRAQRLLTIAEDFVAEQPTPLLDLDESEVRDNIVMRSIRRHKAPDAFYAGKSAGLESGLITFEAQLVREVQAACLPMLDDIIAGQREEFDQHAAALMTASREYGFTMRTRSDDVIDLADERATAAWRATRPAWAKLDRYHSALRRLFRAFEVEVEAPLGGAAPPDMSIYFAAAGNWSRDGAYYLERRTDAGVDWFALAAGGLRLNAPGEIAAKASAQAA